MAVSLLLVEDNRALSLAMSALAERSGLEVTAVPTLARAEAEISKKFFEVILLDIGLPDGNGLELLERCSFEKEPVTAVVSAHGEIENAIAARKLGVSQFFDKPIDFEALESFLREQCQPGGNAVDERSSSRNVTTPFIGASRVMRPVLQQIAQACASKHPVVVSGAAGSGRTHVARLIQSNTESSNPRTSTLQATAGTTFEEMKQVLSQAEGGALIVEDLAMLSLEIQGDLLAELDRIDAEGTRLIATADEGGFRELVLAEKLLPDLYYRFQVLEISLPDLCERAEDIPALISYFIGEQDQSGRVKMSDDLEDVLLSHDWPGNLRELRNVVNFLLVSGGGLQTLTPAQLPPSFLQATLGGGFSGDSLDRRLRDWLDVKFRQADEPLNYRDLHDRLEGRLLSILLERYENKPSRLAEALAMNRVTLRKKLKNREERNAT